MAGLDHGEESFSDDDLDALPHNALDELEQNAILYTQHQTQPTQLIGNYPSSDYGDGLDDDDLDDAVVIDEAQGISGKPQPLRAVSGSSVTQREQFRQARYGGQSNTDTVVDRKSKQKGESVKYITQQRVQEQRRSSESFQVTSVEVLKPALPDTSLEALQKQVEVLLRERDNLKLDLNTKAGEIAIVRSKQEKAAREYERELTVIRKLNTEKLAKQQKAIEAAKEAEKTAATELEFAKRDLVEEAEKVRSLRKAKEKEKSVSELVTTPKKNKSLPYRDGFDDDEIQVTSPSKFHSRKSNPSTPTKVGTKRKRKGQESPILTLEVEQSERPLEGQDHAAGVISNDLLPEKIRKPDRFNLLEMVLDHRPYRDHQRTIEEFAKMAFPSSPQESFASMVFGRLPTLKTKYSKAAFPIEFCELIISLWKRCLAEKYYNPIYLIIDLLTFCMELETVTIAPLLIDTLLPVAQETGDLIAIPRFRCEPFTHLVKHIDVSACLAIIHLTALGCVTDKDHKLRFWRRMRLDFVLMMLSQHQPLKDFDMMLQLLSMSATRDSIGPIPTEPEIQLGQVKYIIDRVSFPLINLPTATEWSQKHDPSVISDLRLQILRTLYAFCQSPWGGEAVAMHPDAIGKLVKLMSDELDALYDHKLGHKKSAHIVSLATRILHYLTTRHEKHIEMQEQLSRIHGGTQKYLICLARLNFSEDDLVLDADIDPEVSECAHEMLELAVTPEEGDAIHSAFSSS